MRKRTSGFRLNETDEGAEYEYKLREFLGHKSSRIANGFYVSALNNVSTSFFPAREPDADGDSNLWNYDCLCFLDSVQATIWYLKPNGQLCCVKHIYDGKAIHSKDFHNFMITLVNSTIPYGLA